MDESNSLRQFHRVILVQGAITLLVFTVATCSFLLFFRGKIRQQILYRDGIVLTEVAQHFHERAEKSGLGVELLDVALESSEIESVIGVGLYSPEGQNLANIPTEMYYASLGMDEIAKLQNNEPVIQYYPELPMDSLFSDIDALIDESFYPVTRVLSPVFDSGNQLVAIINYWLDSAGVAHELMHLDQILFALGAAFIVGGGIVFFLVFYISRNRLLTMGRLLAEQNRSLQKANDDLALAARTSAIGSITSHLFHGLKNPLAGLKAYLQLAGHDDEALEITNRMQNLINESLSVIHDEEGGNHHHLTMGEFVEVSKKRMGIKPDGRIELHHSGDGSLPAQKSQLLLLVIRNLVDNALEATGDSPVLIDFNHDGSRLLASVSDTGHGLPEHVIANLFDPVKSTKENGTGIGLAISSVIARHIPAELKLAKSDSSGTTFSIEMPL